MEKIRGIGNAKFISIALVIAVILSVTALFAIVAYNRISQFENFLAAEGNKVKVIVSDDVKKFEFGLQGARGVFLADKLSFNRDTFRLYSESRDRFSNFNGALGFGFIRAVPKKELAAYKDWVKSRSSTPSMIGMRMSVNTISNSWSYSISQAFWPSNADFAENPRLVKRAT